MPSKTFQPLLFDLLAYKLPKTTYADHYGKNYFSNRKKRSNPMDTMISRAKSSNSLNQKQKMNYLTKRARPFTSTKQLYDEYLAKHVGSCFNSINQYSLKMNMFHGLF